MAREHNDRFERIKHLARLVCQATGTMLPEGLEATIDRVGALLPNEPLRTRVGNELCRRLITIANLHDSQGDEIADQIDHLDDHKNAGFLKRLYIVPEILLHMQQLPDDRLKAGIRATQMSAELECLFDSSIDKRVDKIQSELYDYGLCIISGVE